MHVDFGCFAWVRFKKKGESDLEIGTIRKGNIEALGEKQYVRLIRFQKIKSFLVISKSRMI